MPIQRPTYPVRLHDSTKGRPLFAIMRQTSPAWRISSIAVAPEAYVVVVDTGNRAATVAMTAADAILIPMVAGEGDVTEAARTVELMAGIASAAAARMHGSTAPGWPRPRIVPRTRRAQ